jgi:hypothetical protein
MDFGIFRGPGNPSWILKGNCNVLEWKIPTNTIGLTQELQLQCLLSKALAIGERRYK